MDWMYGITTVGQRTDNLLLDTMRSLDAAGFDSPRIFIDGDGDLPSWIDKDQITRRTPKLKTAGNWFASMLELWIRNPEAERYAIFQDDLIICRGVKEYLEKWYPENGYINLYTTQAGGPQSRRMTFRQAKPEEGWHQTTGRGLGALALVFDHATAFKVLTSEYLVKRFIPSNPRRPPHKFVDGGVVDAMKKVGVKEYAHFPSLVQHTGMVSSMGNMRNARSPFFRENYNPMEGLIEVEAISSDSDESIIQTVSKPTSSPVQHKDGSRIGLVGYNSKSGLGYLNHTVATYAEIDKWIVKPHKQSLPRHEDCDMTICPTGARLGQWLAGVDIVLFAETQYYPRLVDLASAGRKRIVCVPMAEWMPSRAAGWPKKVHLFICPTKQAYDAFSHLVPCVYFPWPCDTDKFKPIEDRGTTCERFLFINGHGGVHNRKGGDVINDVIGLWPEIPLTIISQKHGQWGSVDDIGPNIRIVDPPADNRQLYTYGDVLLVPHAVDGIGLECLEAAACGMPVISTNGEPWNEYPSISKIDCEISSRVFKRPAPYHSCSPHDLVAKAKKILGSDLAEAQLAAREWAVGRSWESKADEFTKLVREGSAELTVKESLRTPLQTKRSCG